ncbi:MAG: RelA/SpoT family protein [Acidimicrobiales bacterium]
MAAADRVRALPWRRQPAPPSPEFAAVLAAYRRRHPRSDVALITRAYDAAAVAHEGQFRRSGEAYIYHPLAVAEIVAGLGLDEISVASALLHDAVEDTGVTLESIAEDFGPTVAALVDGVTKLDRVRFDSREAQQAATVRKMLVAMAKDWRVLLIKLADRLHNMRTIAAMPEVKQRRSAQETMDIYAPLAHRLGVAEVKWQLEDLCFAAMHPRRYAEIDQMVASRAPERDIYLAQVLDAVRARLSELRVPGEVTGRPKHLWSIYEKMVVKGKEFEDIFDLLGIRLMVSTEKDCWAALGAIHAMWSPIPGRFKDYVNTPKFNLYQSLHTTVVGPQGKPVEVQIRTKEMHLRAEFGIAAHWGYKEKAGKDLASKDHASRDKTGRAEAAWLGRIMDWQQETLDPAEFLESLKLDLEQDEVFVFTPKGKVIALPAGSVPVDFAYAIHTEVGHRCIGARVNGRLVPLDSELRSGDTVEIFTSKVPSASPSQDWLKFVATPRARNKIRQWFSRERREDAASNGKEELARALRKEGLPVQRLASSPALVEIAEAMNYTDLESLHAAIGEGHVSARSVALRLATKLRGSEEEDQLPTTVRRGRSHRLGAGVYVEGLDDVMIHLSKCCTPVPGDDIIGFVTRGRGVSVHRSDCANAVSLSTGSSSAGTVERLIDVEWDRQHHGVSEASIEVKALDRSRLLTDVTAVLSEHHLNILASSSHTAPDRVSRMRFDFEIGDPTHLDSLLAALKRIDSVYDAYRVMPGGGAR